MIAISHEISVTYERLLADAGIAPAGRWAYHRWLRFFLDFSAKYGVAWSDPGALSAFDAKLRAKGQRDAPRAQARDAVTLFLRGTRNHPEQSPVTVPSPPAGPMPDLDDAEFFRPVALAPPLGPRAGTPHAGSRVPSIHAGRACWDHEPGGGLERVPAPPILDAEVVAVGPASLVRATGSGVETRYGAEPAPLGWPELFVRLRAAIRVRNYSPRTLESYECVLRQFHAFTGGKPPNGLAVEDVRDFLCHLAVRRRVSAASQNLAFNALLFLFRRVLEVPFGRVEGVVRAKQRRHTPVVLSRREIDAVLSHLAPPYDLVVRLLYGCGLSLFECLQLRVGDLNLDMMVLTVHDGKGRKDRTVPLPRTLRGPLQGNRPARCCGHRRGVVGPSRWRRGVLACGAGCLGTAGQDWRHRAQAAGAP